MHAFLFLCKCRFALPFLCKVLQNSEQFNIYYRHIRSFYVLSLNCWVAQWYIDMFPFMIYWKKETLWKDSHLLGMSVMLFYMTHPHLYGIWDFSGWAVGSKEPYCCQSQWHIGSLCYCYLYYGEKIQVTGIVDFNKLIY